MALRAHGAQPQVLVGKAHQERGRQGAVGRVGELLGGQGEQQLVHDKALKAGRLHGLGKAVPAKALDLADVLGAHVLQVVRVGPLHVHALQLLQRPAIEVGGAAAQQLGQVDAPVLHAHLVVGVVGRARLFGQQQVVGGGLGGDGGLAGFVGPGPADEFDAAAAA